MQGAKMRRGWSKKGYWKVGSGIPLALHLTSKHNVWQKKWWRRCIHLLKNSMKKKINETIQVWVLLCCCRFLYSHWPFINHNSWIWGWFELFCCCVRQLNSQCRTCGQFWMAAIYCRGIDSTDTKVMYSCGQSWRVCFYFLYVFILLSSSPFL